MLDYQDQQSWKAEKLSEQIRNDAALKKGVAIDNRVATAESSRVRQDLRKGVASWVAKKKAHERERAAQDSRPIQEEQNNETTQVDKAGICKVLTLDIDMSDDDYFLATLTNVAGERILDIQVDRDARFCTLEQKITKQLKLQHRLHVSPAFG